MIKKHHAIKKLENKLSAWVRPDLKADFVRKLRTTVYYKRQVWIINALFFWQDVKQFFNLSRFIRK